MNEGRKHQQRGKETESRVTSELIERGIGVLTPAFGNERYDMVIDRSGNLERVQVKTAYDHRQKDQTVVVEFDTTVYQSSGDPQRTYYTGDELDSYLVYCPERETTLYVRFEETPKTQMNFSFREKTAYNDHNQKAVNFAVDYTLDARL
jgi:hypothetical protein